MVRYFGEWVSSKLVLVVGIDDIAAEGYSHCVAFSCIKLHLPLLGPLVESVQVSLQLVGVMHVGYGMVHQTIVCKESDIG